VVKRKIKIVEVGPRDGLQNESVSLPVLDRIEFIQKLIGAGLKFIEGGSFVSPKAIPQLAQSEEVWRALQPSPADLSFLVPNSKGLDRAIEAGVKSIAFFTATSEEFNRRNIGMSVDESLAKDSTMVERLKSDGVDVRIRGYVSTAFGCPYEGVQSVDRVCEVASRLFGMGCEEVSIGDTIGVAHPAQVERVLEVLKKKFDLQKIALHFHDTRGMAIVNIKTALDLGVTIFDSSVGGLGGCPYAQGAAGNIATEEVAWLMEGYGYETGISIENLLEISKWIESKIGRGLKSKLYLSHPTKLFYGGKV
jgi:hydroxymethylglutaryl-CoA lyase